MATLSYVKKASGISPWLLSKGFGYS